MKLQFVFLLIAILSLGSNAGFAQSKKQIKLSAKVEKKLSSVKSFFSAWQMLGDFQLDSIAALSREKRIQLFFDESVSNIPMREDILEHEICAIKTRLGWHFRHYEIDLFAGGKRLDSLIPNYFRSQLAIDSSRLRNSTERKIPLIRRMGQAEFLLGLSNKHLALWHSHGRYYESKLDRWEWQRARLHGTVEDIFPLSFVLPYLVPMLENAGAITMLPRERDIQRHEVIVDNDNSTGGSGFVVSASTESADTIKNIGFRWKSSYTGNENPFTLGSSLSFKPAKNEDSYIDYVPAIPASGSYAVYISYGKVSHNQTVRYTVFSANGSEDFLVNQSMGGASWVYLGNFDFIKGYYPESAKVRLHLFSEDNGNPITADAVKFGGGMGNIARRPSAQAAPNAWSLKGQKLSAAQNKEELVLDPGEFSWKTSGLPRYMEAARYFLQYSGMPDSIVYSLNHGQNDYNDDYQSRGEWVNYLMGKPNGPSGHREVEGLGIPIDLSLAFHTDAGVTPNDSIIGTLGIYSAETDDGKFPNKQSKMVNRDLTDMIQTQIVEDIRQLFNPDWTRRGIWDKPYSEAYRANTPSMLLELLSHQNLADMSFGLDPRFKFAVSRAIYKGILRFFAFQENKKYVVQPLAVNHFSIEKIGDKTILLSWKPFVDPLENSAVPDAYDIYESVGKAAFKLLKRGHKGNELEVIVPDYNKIFSYKVVAVNAGGKSFPSEILSAGFSSVKNKLVLVVNAFDRICGPASFDTGDMAGLALWEDQGVPDKFELSATGDPYNFYRHSAWLDDDSPGWGASHADKEGRIIPGNSFDYPRIHGEAILHAGYSFVSASDESFVGNDFDITPFDVTDIIFGEEKTTKDIAQRSQTNFKVFTKAMRQKLTALLNQGKSLFISGAYIGTDFMVTRDTPAAKFAKDMLHFTWRSNYADRMGMLYGTDVEAGQWKGNWTYNAGYHPNHYTVEAPDAIEPDGRGAKTILRYRRSNASAGVSYANHNYRVVSLGFPFECVLSDRDRMSLMEKILLFLEE